MDMDTSKKFLISRCKHYKGEEENPDPTDKIWVYERFWVEMSMMDEPDFSKPLDEYIDAGLRTFNMYDDTPLTLKALLFNRFMQQAEGMARADDFKQWYDKFYK